MKLRRIVVAALAAAAAGTTVLPAHAHRAWYGAYPGWYGPNFSFYFGAPALWGPYAYPYYYAPGYYRYPPYGYAYPPYAYAYPPYAYPYPPYAYRGPTVYIQKPRVVASASPPPPKAAPRLAAPPPVVERETLSAKELFAFDSATLKLPQPRLDEIALALAHNPAVGNVRITGYTDRLGGDAYNRRLSQRRADAVKAYLVSRGVSADRLVAVGLGSSHPVATCEGVAGERLIACLEPNRRVEIAPFVIERPAG